MTAKTTTSGDQVPLLVTVGISGHRRPEQLGDTDRLKREMRQHFAKIREEMEAMNGPLRFALISPLADGADRLFVEALWEAEPEARLLVPIPFEQGAYEETFLSDASRVEFRELLTDPRCIESFVVPGGRVGDFLRVGRWVVDHADVMFFLHDGSDPEDTALDGGTSSVIQYAWSDLDLPGTSDQEGHAIFVYIDTGDGSASVRGRASHNPHLRHLLHAGGDSTPTDRDDLRARIEDAATANFDEPAGRHQASFSQGTTWIVVLAFLIGLDVLVDWYTGGNSIFNALGPLRYVINWDALGLLGLALLLLLIYRMRNRSALTDWLETRYLAERMRTLPVLLDAGIPLSQVLMIRSDDPTKRDLARVWHSLFFSWQEVSRQLGEEPLAPDLLRSRLVESGGLFSDQIDWHLSKASTKATAARRWALLRNALFALSVLTTLVAAGYVIYRFGQSPDTDLADNVDLASSAISLLLAGVATLAQLKEHGKLSARYRATSRALAGIRRTIRYTETGDTPRHAEELRCLVIEGTEVLMQNTYTWMYTMEQKEPSVA